MKSKYIPMRRESGFTIIELMVGVLIGMIAIVVMFQLFAVSEAQKRTTAGAGEAQQNGVTSLYLLQRDARMSGYGLYHPMLGCQTVGYYNPTAVKFNFRLVPLFIQNGAGGTAPDTITTIYSTTDMFQMPSSITAKTAPGGTTGFVTIGESPYQWKTGSIMILGEAQNINPPATLPNWGMPPTKNCTAMQLSSFVYATGADNSRLHYDSFFYTDENGATRAADFNPPSGIMPAPDTVSYERWDESRHIGGRVLNMGLNPVGNVYSIVNNQLVSRNLFRPADPPIVISDGIVDIQAQYGYASNCPSSWAGGPAIVPAPVNAAVGYVPACSMVANAPSTPTLTTAWPPVAGREQWADSLDPAAMNPNTWRQIVAMRFVVVSRSTQRERVDPATGQCTATTVLPKWHSGDMRDLRVDLNDPLEWKCYRYRVFEGVVPIRNMIWSPDPAGSSVPPA